MSAVEDRLTTTRRRSALAAAAAAVLIALAGCGPEGPRDTGGLAAADPVALLGVLPTPSGLTDDGGPLAAEPLDLIEAILGMRDAARADRVVAAGLRHGGVRRWTAAGGGSMAAAVTVWPSKPIAYNFSLQVSQQDLGGSGVSAWTPRDVPGGQGTRQSGGARVRVLTRTVGPNALVIRASGAVPDAVVAKTMERLIVVQEAKG
ncbi:MAG: hypothetical protein IT200_17640 [Thermoleophilia bacterium]|nr:hypothetical protein [Thermoleophilia bacterium]